MTTAMSMRFLVLIINEIFNMIFKNIEEKGYHGFNLGLLAISY